MGLKNEMFGEDVTAYVYFGRDLRKKKFCCRICTRTYREGQDGEKSDESSEKSDGKRFTRTNNQKTQRSDDNTSQDVLA